MIDMATLNFPQLEQQYGLPAGLLNAVARTESNGNPDAVSSSGAQGLFQFMPATAKQYGIDPLNPQQAAQGAAKYYSDLLKHNNGDLDKALASYNFGPGNVAAGKELPAETQAYIAKVKGLLPKQVADSGQIMSDAAPELPAGFVLDSGGSSASSDLPAGFVLDKTNEEPKTSDSFLGEMASNAKNAISSAKDLLSGNFEIPGRTVPTPKTEALAEKLFPAGSDGSLMGALHNLGNTSPSDFSGALLEKFGETPAGKTLSVLGGLNPVWNAAGTAVNRYVNPAISSATGINPENLALMELAAPTLGLKQAGKINDPTVSLVKSVLSPQKAAVASASDFTNQANTAYQTASAKGGILLPQVTNKFLSDIGKIIPQTSAGKLVFGDSATAQLVDKFNALKDKPLTLQAAQELDEGLGDAIDAQIKEGRLSKEGKKIADIQTSFRDSIENASPSDVVGGKSGFDALKDARDLWARSRRMADVERIIARAEGMDQPAKAIQSGFNTLKNNQKRMRGFSADERAAINQAAKTGIVTDALRLVGSRLTPIAVGAAGLAGGGIGALGAAAAQYGLSALARNVAAKRQTARAQNVLNTIARGRQSRSVLPTITKGVQALPNTTADALLGGLLQQTGGQYVR